MPLELTAQTASQALDIASARGLLPTSLGSAEMREQLAAAVRRNAVFSAKTTNAVYVQAIKERVERLLQGGYNNDWAKLRLELKQLLQQIGYDPATGFPGDEALGIEPAAPGSLQDLSSDLRINLILDTQEKLMRGSAQKARGEDGMRARQFPAWELVRTGARRVERGSPQSHTKGWVARFTEAGGEVLIDAEGRERLVALKGDPVWQALGDSAIFSDALDTDHPPFAFNSGMTWVEVHHAEAADLGVKSEKGEVKSERPVIDAPRAPQAAEALPDATKDRLRDALKRSKAKFGDMSMDSILKGASGV